MSMRNLVLLCLASAVLAGCASSASNTANLSTKSKLAQKMALITDVKKRMKTASCKEIDEAMAYSYLLQRATVDKELVSKPNDKAKGISLIYRGYFKDFRKAYSAKCKDDPIRTVAVQKLYPDIMRASKKKLEAKKKAAETKQASR